MNFDVFITEYNLVLIHSNLRKHFECMATLQDQIPRAWYMDNIDADQREPHRLEGYDVDVNVSLNQLAKLGVLYWKVGWLYMCVCCLI